MMCRLENSRKVVGTKQTLKYLEKNKVSVVYIADDAESFVTSRIIKLAESKNVEIVKVESMEELGKKCKIEIKAAVAAIIKEV